MFGGKAQGEQPAGNGKVMAESLFCQDSVLSPPSRHCECKYMCESDHLRNQHARKKATKVRRLLSSPQCHNGGRKLNKKIFVLIIFYFHLNGKLHEGKLDTFILY